MVQFNPYDWAFHEDPYPVYQKLREEAPVYYNEELDFYALSRHEDVVQGLKNYQDFSNRRGVALENIDDYALKVQFILAMDPPEHMAMRGIVRKVFTPRRVAELEPYMRELSQEYLSQFPANGEVDFIEAFAGKLPMDIISEIVGVPVEDRDKVRGWANDLMERIDGSPELPEGAIAGSIHLLTYFINMVKTRLADIDSAPDDLTTEVLKAELDGRKLTEEEAVAFLFLMSVAGNETTTKLLANALYWGQQFPEQFQKVMANPGLMEAWVEETARFDNSSQMVYRTAQRDIELHGVTIKEGKKVAMLLGSANRDATVFDRPDEYDIERDFSTSMAFGKGVHFCLGAALARLEGKVFLEELFKVYRGYKIDESSLVRVHSGNVRGFSAMKVQFFK